MERQTQSVPRVFGQVVGGQAGFGRVVHHLYDFNTHGPGPWVKLSTGTYLTSLRTPFNPVQADPLFAHLVDLVTKYQGRQKTEPSCSMVHVC